MTQIEFLFKRYRAHIAAPWQRNLAGEQKMIFVVYPPASERRLRAKLPLFEMATLSANRKWREFDFTGAFARWMSGLEYKEIYFQEPENLTLPLRTDFPNFVVGQLLEVLTDEGVDDNTVVAVYGVASLYGLTRASTIFDGVTKEIRGRLLAFFPGEFQDNNYRLLGARDGWNYLAVPITLHDRGD